MPGEMKLEILFGSSIYVLRSPECALLLHGLDAVPELGNVTGSLREDLRQALSGVQRAENAPNPFEDESEDPPVPWEAPKAAVKSVAAENAAECGDCRVPRCRFCDKPGKMVGGRKDSAGRMVERYYVCETAGCLAAKVRTPQPAKLFAGG